MILYFSFILLDLAVFYLVPKTKGALRLILITLGVLLPCIVAGSRADNVGTDMQTYGIRGYELAKETPWQLYYRAFYGWHPIGYSFVTWLVGFTFRNRIAYFGVIQLFSIVPFYFGARRYTDKYIWIAMYVYLFILFPFSLNAMKQMIAVSISFFSFDYALKKKPVKYYLGIAVALLFHQSAAIMLLTYPIIRVLCCSSKNETFISRNRNIVAVATTGVLFIIAFVFGRAIIPLLPFFHTESKLYILKHADINKINYSALAALLIFGISYFVVCRLRKRGEIPHKGIDSSSSNLPFLYMFFSCFAWATFQLDLIGESLSRLSSFFLPYTALYVISLLQCKKKSLVFNYLIVVLILLTFLFIYSYFVFAIKGAEEIFPFKTFF